MWPRSPSTSERTSNSCSWIASRRSSRRPFRRSDRGFRGRGAGISSAQEARNRRVRRMARSTKAQEAWEQGRAAADNEYVRRLIEDEELRDNIRLAFRSAKKAYGRMSNGKAPAKTLMDDKKVHKDLRNAAESLREASDQLRGKQEGHGFRNFVLVAIVGAALALVLS